MDINGKGVAASIRQAIKKEIDDKGLTPTLAFFLIEDHAPSKVYVGMKQRACKEVGITSIIETLQASITEEMLITKISAANANPEIDAILVQMPLPDHIDSNRVIYAIDPAKDVDGFHPVNIGKMLIGDSSASFPCTPLGICTLLEKENIETAGKNIAILGRSMIVGRPLANMLSSKGKDATVTLLHSKSKNLSFHLKNADIIISAIGKALFVKKEMVKQGAVCIDVGTNHIDGVLVGDIDYKNVKEVASKITPVPGGVGPMTIAMLLQNTVKCHKILAS
ncbi:MAG: Bifunctional protein FolD protein [Chlamydiia bacterium]|nr:Bifunctional protein FolD protein [Chlamydiia bacterium]MCH9618159.1 Bifunctional protein FolD protein [Chlamydiia bacterium]MCH9624469.1 Bifunctional protein FolD protein [Chlamydiia bacterium]